MTRRWFLLLKILLCTASFILLCVAAMRLNLNRTERAKQFLMPVIALIYGILVLLFLNDIYVLLARLIRFLEEHIFFISRLHLDQYLIYIVNAVMVLGFLIVKAIALPILKRTWGGSENLMEATSGHFYEYEVDKWFVQPGYGEVKTYYKGLYIAAAVISSLVFVLSQYFPGRTLFPDRVLSGLRNAYCGGSGQFPFRAYQKGICGRHSGRG